MEAMRAAVQVRVHNSLHSSAVEAIPADRHARGVEVVADLEADWSCSWWVRTAAAVVAAASVAVVHTAADS